MLKRLITLFFLTVADAIYGLPCFPRTALRFVLVYFLTLGPLVVSTQYGQTQVTQRELDRLDRATEKIADATAVQQSAIATIQSELAVHREQMRTVTKRQDKTDEVLESLTSSTRWGILSIWAVGLLLGMEKLKALWDLLKGAAPIVLILAKMKKIFIT